MDLSFNNFKMPDIQQIGEGLKRNHNILGAHFMGNEAKVDELGFVTPEKVWNGAAYHVFTRIPCNKPSNIDFNFLMYIDHLKMGTVKRGTRVALNVCSNCWICEGWSSIKFCIEKHKVKHAVNKNKLPKIANNGGEAIEDQEKPSAIKVSIHLNFDGYKPHRLVEGSEDGVKFYFAYLMVPPGSLNYFYSVGDPS